MRFLVSGVLLPLLFTVGTATGFGQEAPPAEATSDPVDQMVSKVEEALNQQVAQDKVQEDREVALNALSQFMKFIDKEEKFGHISPERGKELQQLAVELSSPYGSMTAQQVRDFSAVQRQGNVVRVLYVLVACLAALTVLIILSLIFQSAAIIEGTAYLISGALFFECIPSGWGMTSFAQAFAAAIIFSITFSSSIGVRKVENARVLGHAVLLLVWSVLALIHRDSYMGFIATGCLISMIGFVVVPFGGGYALGWKDEKNINPTLVISVGILLIGIFADRFSFQSQVAQWSVVPFITGFLVLGASVSLIGYLIQSSRYWEKEGERWILMNLIYIVLTLGMIWAGAAWNVPHVRGIAFTLGFFWLLDKMIELDLGDWGWVLKLGGATGLGYAVIQFLQRNPELFR